MQISIESETASIQVLEGDRYLGLAMVVASIALIVAGILHPEDSPAGMINPVWGTVHSIFFLGLFISLIGVTRIYGLISTTFSWLGSIGFLLFALGIGRSAIDGVLATGAVIGG